MIRQWMPLYVADYRADTAHLNAAQHGAYLLLIMHYWQTGGLPVDDAPLARIACMTPAEWRKTRPLVASFFTSDWKHKRVDKELARAADISNKRRASAQQKHSKSSAIAEQVDTHARTCAGALHPHTQTERIETDSISKPPELNHSDLRSDAGASRDFRADLFNKGLKTLANITGKTPDSCRSLVGKWLKLVNDEAIHVIGLIEDAERNRMANPVGWITKSLQNFQNNGVTFNGKRTVHAAAADLLDRVRALDEPIPGELRDGEGESPIRRLPAR